MPYITYGRDEHHITQADADRLLRDGIVHMPNPFDRAALELCPEHTWDKLEQALSERCPAG